MSETLLADLRTQLSSKRLIVVVGAGVSMSATNAPAATWTGLLTSGLERVEEVTSGLPTGWRKLVEKQITSGETSWLIQAASEITQRLGGPFGGEYRRWLRESVGSLTLHNKGRRLVRAISQLEVPVLTTNYDSLLEYAFGTRPVIWTESALVQRILRGEDRSVAHLHGHWESPSSVVLGIESYEKVLAHEPTQALQHYIGSLTSLLFIGFGGGLHDPNFSALRRWIADTFPDREHRHFRLCRSSDLNDLSRSHETGERIFPVAYGADYDDLAPFLEGLASPKASGSRHLPVHPDGMPSPPDFDATTDVIVRVLGEVSITRDGVPLASLGDEMRDTLALVALSGSAGISTPSLIDQLPGQDGLSLTPTTVHQRVLSLRKHVPVGGGGRARTPYALDRARVSVDADAFVAGVGLLGASPDPAEVDKLLGLWRDDPWTGSRIARARSWGGVREARTRLIDLVTALDDDARSALTDLGRFVALFPDDRALDRLHRACRERPRLLVIEDEIMDDLRSILDSEFHVQPVVDIAGWNTVRETLDVDGVLIDRHLTPTFTDDRGTTVIADFLRRHTEIPAVLMTVAPPPTTREHTRLQAKYRLLEVVHKRDHNGTLNERHLLDAARALVDQRDPGRRARLQLWVDSDLYHVEDDHAFDPRSPVAARRLAECRKAAEALRPVLTDGPIDDAELAVRRFHREWGPRPPAATS